MKLFAACVVAMAVVSLSGGCGGRGEAVPLPRAFARVQPYGDSLTDVSMEDLSLKVNALADTACPRPNWLDIAFGRYGATMHVSVMRFDNYDGMLRALHNRAERISLNLAGRRAVVEEFVGDGGFRVRLTRSLEPSPVPLQFFAVDDTHTFVSGAVALSGAVEPADSLAPVLEELYRQTLITLSSLRHDGR